MEELDFLTMEKLVKIGFWQFQNICLKKFQFEQLCNQLVSDMRKRVRFKERERERESEESEGYSDKLKKFFLKNDEENIKKERMRKRER